MFDDSVRSFAHQLWLTISADSLPGFCHMQGVWAVFLRANSFCLVLLFCQFIIFDHIKVFEQATSSSTALEFILAAPPLPHCSSRWLLICRLLSLCSLSFSPVMLLLVDSFVNVQHFLHTWTGFSSCSKLASHQNLGCRLSYCASFNLSSLCFGIVIRYFSSFCSLFVASYSSCPLRSVQRRLFSSISFSNLCSRVRSPVSATIYGLVFFCEYLILSSIVYLSSFCSRFVASYSSCSLRSFQRRMLLPISFSNFGPRVRSPVSATIFGLSSSVNI